MLLRGWCDWLIQCAVYHVSVVISDAWVHHVRSSVQLHHLKELLVGLLLVHIKVHCSLNVRAHSRWGTWVLIATICRKRLCDTIFFITLLQIFPKRGMLFIEDLSKLSFRQMTVDQQFWIAGFKGRFEKLCRFRGDLCTFDFLNHIFLQAVLESQLHIVESLTVSLGAHHSLRVVYSSL